MKDYEILTESEIEAKYHTNADILILNQKVEGVNRKYHILFQTIDQILVLQI